MKVIVTGAASPLGQIVVPQILKAGLEMVLVTQSGDQEHTLYPNVPSVTLSALSDTGSGIGSETTVLLHLAILQSNTADHPDDYAKQNVAFLQDVLAVVQKLGVRRVIYPASPQAKADTQDPYKSSRFEAEQHLNDAVKDSRIDQLTLLAIPAVYTDDQFRGRLTRLNSVPKILRAPLIALLGALYPILHGDRLATTLIELLGKPPESGVNTLFLADDQSTNIAYRIGQRIMDIGFAVSIIVILWWALILVWIAVKLTSPGPGIFAQPRVGKAKKTFTCLKFRTMNQGTRQAGTHEMSTAEVTNVGKFLRASKLDELPQIVNLLRGDMSLVGPRPGLPIQTELSQARDARGIFKVRPGITGLAQVQGVDMSEPETLARLDAEYVARRSLLLDLRLLLATVSRRAFGDKIAS
jgi:lipopolysaccharide/colanic/teichoic acid biosynthesis glycosyltransferase